MDLYLSADNHTDEVSDSDMQDFLLKFLFKNKDRNAVRIAVKKRIPRQEEYWDNDEFSEENREELNRMVKRVVKSILDMPFDSERRKYNEDRTVKNVKNIPSDFKVKDLRDAAKVSEIVGQSEEASESKIVRNMENRQYEPDTKTPIIKEIKEEESEKATIYNIIYEDSDYTQDFKDKDFKITTEPVQDEIISAKKREIPIQDIPWMRDDNDDINYEETINKIMEGAVGKTLLNAIPVKPYFISRLEVKVIFAGADVKLVGELTAFEEVKIGERKKSSKAFNRAAYRYLRIVSNRMEFLHGRYMMNDAGAWTPIIGDEE